MAMGIGALAGMSPDLDVVIRSAEYPLLGLKFHRHFTHAIPISPLWGLLVAGFFWLCLRIRCHPRPFLPIYIISVIAIICHGVLDSMTNYGTHLFWPLTSHRESWSIISIIDPLFTLPLLLAVILAARAEWRQPLRVAWLYMLLYWGAGMYQHHTATLAMEALAEQRGHAIVHAEVKPAFGNLLAWRTQYISEDAIYIDALHHSPWHGLRWYEGGALPLITPNDSQFTQLSALQKQDLQDFAFFSDGWLTPISPTRMADARFGILPNSLRPMWAVEVYPDEPRRHAGFVSLRPPIKKQDWRILWQMILGEET